MIMNGIRLFPIAALLSAAGISPLAAQVPRMIDYQGKIAVAGVNFSGSGQFKFALVNGTGSVSYWSHDGTSTGGSAPATHVVRTVAAGLYSIVLGDTTILNSAGAPVQAIGPAVFNNSDVRLRVWFNDGTNGFQQLAPDRRIAAVAYALMADSVPDGSITTAKLAPGSVTADKLAAATLLASLSASDAALLGQGYIKVQSVPAPAWQASAASGGPDARSRHTAIWTGSGMIVWGGKVGTALSNQGANYNPGTSQWATLPTSSVSPARSDHTAVWAGDRMVVWGGFTAGGESQTGAFYAPTVPGSDPPIGGWLATSLTNAPGARSGHTAVWTGTKMIVWGGKNSGGALATGGLYTPPAGPLVSGVEGSWTGTQTTGAPAARHNHTAVWTGTKMLIWGGLDSSFLPLNNGGIYDPAANTWTAMSATGAPGARAGHTAIWTGTKMVIFGGTNTELPGSAANLLNDGAAFDPVSGTWTPLPSAGAPSARHRHGAVWTGSEMLIFAGEQFSGQFVTTAAAFNPTTGAWRTLPSAATGSAGKTGVWSGSTLLTFGTDGLFTLDPAPAVHFYGKF